MIKSKNLSAASYPLLLSIIGWSLFALCYSILKNINGMEIFSAWFPLLGESSLDSITAIFAFNLSKKSNNIHDKKLFLILAISFFSSFISDLIYNVYLNFFKFNYQGNVIVCFFDIPFMIFLLMQLILWSKIILSNKKQKFEIKKILST